MVDGNPSGDSTQPRFWSVAISRLGPSARNMHPSRPNVDDGNMKGHLFPATDNVPCSQMHPYSQLPTRNRSSNAKDAW